MKNINLALNSEIVISELAQDDGIKGHKFYSKFIEAGIAHYDEYGDVLIRKETLNKFVDTMIGCPVIINHNNITPENVEQERVGVVSNVRYDDYSGWFTCEGIIWDKQAISLIKNEGWTVSCAYKFVTSEEPVMYHGKKVDMEFIDGDFQHLAIVKNPRYENAEIVVNSMNEDDMIENGGPGSGDFDHAGRPPKKGGSEPAGTGRKGKYKDGKQQWIGKKPEDKASKERQDKEISERLKKYEGNKNIQAYLDGEITPDELGEKEPDLTREEWHTLAIERMNREDKRKADKSESKEKSSKEEQDISKEEYQKLKDEIPKYSNEKLAEEFLKSRDEFEKGNKISPRAGSLTEHEAKYGIIAQELKKRTGRGFGLSEDKDEIMKALKSSKGKGEEKYITYKGKSVKLPTKPIKDTERTAYYNIPLDDKRQLEVDYDKKRNQVGFYLSTKQKDGTAKSTGYFTKDDERNRGIDPSIIKDVDKHIRALHDKQGSTKQLSLFNSKERNITMTVLNELQDWIERTVQNALGKDDKRAGIDKVAGIMKSEDCSEEAIRTAIGVMEKIAYDKSEAGTADNKCSKNEDKKEVKNACVKNEDKRKLIDEIGGVLKGKVDDEVIKTIIGKAEKIAYEPSEDDKADNAKEDKKEVKNSMEDLNKILYKGNEAAPQDMFTPRAERLENGKKF